MTDRTIPPPILVWAFHEAPEELQKLSTNGGDEDWIAVVPAHYRATPSWLEGGYYNSFGCSEIEQHPHPTDAGLRVYIGCHS